MARCTAPLLSLDATGNFAKVLNFSHGRRGSVVRKKKPNIAPPDPKNPVQLFFRDFWGDVVSIWHASTSGEKANVELSAIGRHMSGFNFFIKEYLSRRPTEAGSTRLGYCELG